MIDITTYALCKQKIKNAIDSIETFNFVTVPELPPKGEGTHIYLIKKATTLSSITQNIYDEYIWADNAWEYLGTTQLELSQYIAKKDLQDQTGTSDELTMSQNAITQNLNNKEPKIHIGDTPPEDLSKLWIDTSDNTTNGLFIDIKTKDEWAETVPQPHGVYLVYDPSAEV